MSHKHRACATPVQYSLSQWELVLVGPPDTPYEGGIFKAMMKFPEDFPNSPPEMTFLSKMYHPNGPSLFDAHVLDVPFHVRSPPSCGSELRLGSLRGRQGTWHALCERTRARATRAPWRLASALSP